MTALGTVLFNANCIQLLQASVLEAAILILSYKTDSVCFWRRLSVVKFSVNARYKANTAVSSPRNMVLKQEYKFCWLHENTEHCTDMELMWPSLEPEQKLDFVLIVSWFIWHVNRDFRIFRVLLIEEVWTAAFIKST